MPKYDSLDDHIEDPGIPQEMCASELASAGVCLPHKTDAKFSDNQNTPPPFTSSSSTTHSARCTPARSVTSWRCALTVLFSLLVAFVPTVVMYIVCREELRDSSSPHWNHDQKALAIELQAIDGWRFKDIFLAYLAANGTMRNDTKVRTPATSALCTNNADVFPGAVYQNGTVNDTRWEPDACTLKHFSVSEGRECLRQGKQRFAFFGDSLMDGVAIGFGQKSNLTMVRYDLEEVGDMHSRYNNAWFLDNMTEPIAEFYWTQSAFLMDPSDATARPNASHALRSADVIVLHHSLWDMSLTCRGVISFYKALKRRIHTYQRTAKPGARIIVFDLHWLFPGRCVVKYGLEGRCFRWNRLDKTVAYREALRLAAACTGVELYSNIGIYKAMPQFTRDGVHFEVPPVMNLESDVFMNGICRRGNSPPMTFVQPEHYGCNEDTMIDKWISHPRTLVCPKQTRYEY